jgi:hypothetical protein
LFNPFLQGLQEAFDDNGHRIRGPALDAGAELSDPNAFDAG